MPACEAASNGGGPMLKAVESGTAVVVCSTCRFSAQGRDDRGVRGGARLGQALRALAAADARYARIAIQDMPCLFACGDHCTVHLRAPGKISYVLGRFVPDEEAARAILDYAVCYAGSDHGRVPYADWPDGVKGHFITRSPPEGYVAL
jgi:predicted metal-binding protein